MVVHGETPSCVQAFGPFRHHPWSFWVSSPRATMPTAASWVSPGNAQGSRGWPPLGPTWTAAGSEFPHPAPPLPGALGSSPPRACLTAEALQLPRPRGHWEVSETAAAHDPSDPGPCELLPEIPGFCPVASGAQPSPIISAYSHRSQIFPGAEAFHAESAGPT